MARAAARFAAADVPDLRRAAAIRRILGALESHPDHVSGRDAPTAKVVHAVRDTGTRFAMKVGAEGFVVAFLPDRALGIAIKMADGAPRGKMAVLATLLARLGVLPADRAAALAEAVEDPINDSNGRPAGRVHATL